MKRNRSGYSKTELRLTPVVITKTGNVIPLEPIVIAPMWLRFLLWLKGRLA